LQPWHAQAALRQVCEDRFGKSMPRGLAGIRQVERPERCPGLQGFRHDGEDRLRDVPGRRRRPMLVRDDANLFPFSRHAQHRFEEIAALCTVDPGSPQDDVIGKRLANRALPCFFAGPISVDRMDRVIFNIGTRFGPIDYIVGRQM